MTVNELADRLDPVGKARFDELVAMPDNEFRAWLVDNAKPLLASAVTVHLIDRVIGYRRALDQVNDRVRSNGVDTSDEAAANMYRHVTAARALVLRTVDQLGVATCDDVEAVTGGKHQTVSARMYELRKGGYLEYTGDKAPTRTGNQARLHRLTPDGRRELAARGEP